MSDSRLRQVDREGRVRGAGVPFRDRHIVDADGRWRRRRRRRPELVVDQHGDIAGEIDAAVGIARGGIEPAVAVEVARRDGIGVRARGGLRRIREGAVTAAVEHAHVGGVIVGCGDVDVAVASEVAQHDRDRVTAGGIGLSRAESAHTVAKQHTDAVVVVAVRGHEVDGAVAIHVPGGDGPGSSVGVKNVGDLQESGPVDGKDVHGPVVVGPVVIVGGH